MKSKPRRGSHVLAITALVGALVGPLSWSEQPLAANCDFKLPPQCDAVANRVSPDIPPWTIPRGRTYKFTEPVYFNPSPGMISGGGPGTTVGVRATTEFTCEDRALQHIDLRTSAPIFYSCGP